MRQRSVSRPALGVVVLCLLSASLVCATPVTVAVTTSTTFEHALCTEENFTPLGHGYGACEWVFTAPTHDRVIVNIDHLFLFGFERALFYDGASAASPLINGCERGEYYSSFLERPESMTPVYSEYWNYYYELPVEAISLSNNMYVRVIVWINSPFNVSMEILAGASTVHNPNHADVNCALNDYIPTPAAPAPPPAPTVVPITQAVQSIEVSAGYGVSFVEGATWILQAEDGYAVQVNMTDVFLAADECIVIYDGGSTATPVIFSGCGVDYYYSSSYSTFSSSSYSSSSSPDGTTTGVTTTAGSATTTGGSQTTTVVGTTMNGGTTGASMSGSSSSDNDTSSASSMTTSPSGTTDSASSATTTQPPASASTTTAPGTTSAGASSATSSHGGTTSPAATGTTTDHDISTTTSGGGGGGGGSSGSSTLYSAYTDFVFPLSSGPQVTILLFSWGESSYYYYYGCANITARAEVDLDGPPPPMTTTGSSHYATTHGAATTTTASGNGGTTTSNLPGTAPNPTTLGGSSSGTTGAAASASGGDGSSPAALQALGANAPSAGLSTGGVAAVSIGSIAFVAIVVAVIIAVVLARRRNTSAAAAHARDNTMVDANEMAHEFVDLDAPLRNAPHHSVKPPSSEGEEEEETERAERVANTAGPAPRATSTATNGPRRPSIDDDNAV